MTIKTGRTARIGGWAAAMVLALLAGGCASAVGGTAAPAVTPSAVITSPVSTQTSPEPSTTSSARLSASSPESTTSPETSSPTPSSPTPGSPTSSRATRSSSASGTTSTSRSDQFTTGTIDPSEFAAKLTAGNAGVKSVKGTITMTSGSVTVDGTYAETVAANRVTGMSMNMFITVSGQRVPMKLLLVGGKTYIGGDLLLTAVGAGSKSWALASATSSNSTLRSLSTSMAGLTSSAGVTGYELLALTAATITDGGAAEVGAVAAHKYLLSSRNGDKTSLWLDSGNRVVQVEVTSDVSGEAMRVKMTMTGYNSGVAIKAPAASDVYTG